MDITLTGATRLNIIVGDPIAQVRSPGGMTTAFTGRGHDGIVAPVCVAVEDLGALLESADKLKNLDGIIVTVPHKFACYQHCTSATERSDFVSASSIMRRKPDGTWHGDMIDGYGFVQAMRQNGCEPKGKRALLIGAGGAGSAIAYELVTSGVAELAIHDGDAARRDRLIARLTGRGGVRVFAGSPDPTGFTLVCNATPAGMKDGDPLPVEADKLTPEMFVGCVITKPAVSPLVVAARAKGCATSTGGEMYEALQAAMVDFLMVGARAG
ncbi:shikimate dehydrogenase family protein [Acidimangrovimonas sediminis]|uniref:shikimate dehydrogenase family protein n=1 Tax=Acidimangrovimonas sediminis TaxID=2056283 RepID=UPI000C7FBCA4|nr:shikimate dehydrogenase [Acidimangrovimonas sediminis]